MEYWIVENDQQVGPLSKDDLLAKGITAESLVWHDGLSDWTPACQVPSLCDIFKVSEETDIDENDIEQEIALDEDLSLNGKNDSSDSSASADAGSSEEHNPIQEPEQEPKPPCPPTNLVWAVISLICCCFPLSVVAIIYASQVRTKYDCGDYEGAKKASETAAWWTILSIVLGLICQPFISLFQIIGSGI